MIRYSNIKNIASYMAVFALFIFHSCSNETYDITGSTENVVFLNAQTWSPIDVPNGVLFNLTETPLAVTLDAGEKIETKIVARCTKPAASDIRVSFEYDKSLIQSSYSAFPEGVSMDKKELTIPQGATRSNDSITLSATGNLSIFKAGQYMAPVRIVSAGDVALGSQNSTSIVVKTAFNNIQSGATSVPGSTIARTDWTATLAGAAATNLFDGSTTTYSTTTMAVPFNLEIDMQSVQADLEGIRLQYSNQSYSLTSANVYTKETSTDEYKYQGKISVSRSTSQYIRFIEKVSARYVKVEILTMYSTSYAIRLSEVNLYRQ